MTNLPNPAPRNPSPSNTCNLPPTIDPPFLRTLSNTPSWYAEYKAYVPTPPKVAAPVKRQGRQSLAWTAGSAGVEVGGVELRLDVMAGYISIRKIRSGKWSCEVGIYRRLRYDQDLSEI
jgi:hypothetical protein